MDSRAKQVLMDEFDRDRSVEGALLRPVYCAHSAAVDQRYDLVSIDDRASHERIRYSNHYARNANNRPLVKRSRTQAQLRRLIAQVSPRPPRFFRNSKARSMSKPGDPKTGPSCRCSSRRSTSSSTWETSGSVARAALVAVSAVLAPTNLPLSNCNIAVVDSHISGQ
jgi:hypothetical protein